MNNLERDLEKNLDDLLGIAYGAGGIIMGYLKAGFKVFEKSDGSPVTEADKASDIFISKQLERFMPGITVISEEGYEDDPKKYSKAPDIFWCVDPLDGTKNFINGTNEFTVNIGLVKNKKPIFGILYVPSGDRLYFSTPQGGFKICGGVKTKLTPKCKEGNIYIVTSPRTSDKQISIFAKHSSDCHLDYRHKKMASSEKFCYLADSECNVFPCAVGSKEWDTVAGHAILNSVGGMVFGPDGNELSYGKDKFENTNFLAISNPKSMKKEHLQKLLSMIA